jgi:glycine/D-amino acid oxidase-like deaminating enzyme
LHAPDDDRSYRSLSLWLDTLGPDDHLVPRAPLPGRVDCDVAIVGGGLTGIWTAYYLARQDPTLRIVVVEAEVVGFGASGRNGGWASALLPMSLTAMERRHGRAAALAMHRAMTATVDEVAAVTVAEGTDCHLAKGGSLELATSPAQVDRVREIVAEARQFGLGEEDVRWLDRREASERVAASGVLGAAFTPHCAAVHPARLVRGLASAVERRGVRVYERTRATALAPGLVTTPHGELRAGVVVRATEAFTAALPGERRTVAPLYSLMIATEPLPSATWERLGWAGRETVNDGRHLIIYAQRTADGRIAFGGRGAPYHFGSRISPAFDRNERVFADLQRTLTGMFPPAIDAAITHAWGGPLAAPRDWHCSVTFDRATGLAAAGGYVGDGVSTTNLAGRTLASLITGTDDDLTHLPWVGHHSPRWEPEPLRWLAINGSLRLPRSADEVEARTGRPERARTWLLGKILGR